MSAEVYSVRDKIRDIAGELALDEQATGLTCPYCAGGSSGEKSLSVIRKANKAEYFCHRASCNMHGAVNMAGRELIVAKKKEYHAPPEFKMEGVPEDIVEKIKGRISKRHIMLEGIMWCPTQQRLALPIRNRYNQRIGWVFRAIEKTDKSKAYIRLTDSSFPVMSWHRKDGDAFGNWGGTPIVLVEDIPSAYKATEFVHSIALLGTNLSDNKVADIAKMKPRKVLIALDEDATAKAAAALARYDGVFDSVELRPLTKDLKDCSSEEIKEVLKLGLGEHNKV